MISKGFLIGAEFEEAFKDNLYFDIDRSTNEVADYLKEGLESLKINILPSPTNQIFVILPKDHANLLIKEFALELWEDKGDQLVIRIVTSFTTSKEDVDALIGFVKSNLC